MGVELLESVIVQVQKFKTLVKETYDLYCKE